MKTSNKILLGLLVIIFGVPFLLAASLKAKIDKGEYTIERDSRPQRPGKGMHSGSFTAFRVVHVIAPHPESLTCHLKLSDKMAYTYNNYYSSKDSITVYATGDTLYIRYHPGQEGNGGKEKRWFNPLYIEVNLPACNDLVVDGAVLIIDSAVSSSGKLSVTLKNKGVIKEGGRGGGPASVKEPEGAGMNKGDVLPLQGPGKAIIAGNEVNGKMKKLVQAKPELLKPNMDNLLVFHLLDMSWI